MKALVTGGAGFIGSNLAEFLLAGGHQVVVLDDLSSGHRRNVEELSGVHFIEGDVTDPAAVREAMATADVVFHMAASVGNARSIAAPERDSEVNVLGTIRVLEEMRRRGVRRLVYSSSAGVYGELKTLPIREDHPLQPESPYGVSKLAGELHAMAYARLYGIGAVALRYFNVYGPRQRYDAYGNVIPIFVQRLLDGDALTIFGDGEQTRDFINVRDVVRANVAAAGGTATGAFNLGSGSAISINGLVRLLDEVAGGGVAATFGPPRPGDVRDSLADVGPLAAAFGFEPSVALRDGLGEYVAWARSERLESAPQGVSA